MDTNQSSESNGSNAGGNESNEQNTSDTQQPVKDSVSYDTHRRLLDEKKKAQAELNLLRAEKAERERSELESKGEYQKIIEIERKRAEEAVNKLKEYDTRFTEAKKMSALLKALDNGVDEKFFGFLPLDQVVVDQETGEVNLTSVASVAEDFKKGFPELLKPKNGPRLPNQAPQAGGPMTISESEWKKLSAQDMRKWKFNQINWEE